MNINIKPIAAFVGTAEVLDIVGASVFLESGANFSYRLLNKDGKVLHHGQVQMNPTEYASWGADDKVAAKFVADKIGAEIVSIDPPYLGTQAPSLADKAPTS